MKKAISVLLSAALALWLLAGCGQSPSSVPQSGSTPASGSETAAEPVTIKIWHDGGRGHHADHCRHCELAAFRRQHHSDI